jgi:hypothetical protein
MVELYASWGVDFIKVDDICSRPYHAAEIEALDRAIKRCGRPIVLSLSPGDLADPAHAEHLKAHCHMWRISVDFWDRWDLAWNQFRLCHQWSSHSGPGHWADADMLPFGRIAIRGVRPPQRDCLFTEDEQRTVMTLWAIFRSPLMLGGELPSLDDWTLALLTNPEVLAVNQHGTDAAQCFRQDGRIIWRSQAADKEDVIYLALFNAGSHPATLDLADADLDSPGPWRIRDLWARQDLPEPQTALSVTLPPHACRLLSLRPA